MSSIDLLDALGNAGEKDIEASAGELPGRKPVWKTVLRWGAAAAAVCIGMIALRSADRSKNITVTMPSYQTADPSRQSGPELTYYINEPAVTTTVLYAGIVENRFLTLPDTLPLLTENDWEIPEERHTLYFVNSHAHDEGEETFGKIRDALKQYERDYPGSPRAQYAIYSSVYSLKKNGSPVVREWLSPVVELGRIKGIYTVTQSEGSGQIQAVYTERNEESEGWIGRLEGLGQFSSEKDPVCFLRDDRIGLIALAGGNAYLICRNEWTETAVSEIHPAQYVPDSKELQTGRVELSGTGIPVPYHAELTPEQQERFKDILFSMSEDPYMPHYDLEGMSEEEIQAYFREVSNYQSPAVTVANYLERNMLLHYDENGSPVYREEYAGCYIQENKLCVLVPSHVEGAKEYMDSLFENGFRERVIFREVEYSWNELERFLQEEVLPALTQYGIRWYILGTSETQNCVLVSVSEYDLIKCCELVLKEGWIGKVKVERGSEPVLTSADAETERP
ncbi:MAG: hypothetical protein J5493_02765 [Lachnospiraceae bacterium]|nr:hypothetical protein [Lachnospiraceae bacterium]